MNELYPLYCVQYVFSFPGLLYLRNTYTCPYRRTVTSPKLPTNQLSTSHTHTHGLMSDSCKAWCFNTTMQGAVLQKVTTTDSACNWHMRKNHPTATPHTQPPHPTPRAFACDHGVVRGRDVSVRKLPCYCVRVSACHPAL